MKAICIAAALAAFAAPGALAQTAAEDAARIEVLIGLEQAAKRGGAIAATAPASPAAVSPAATADRDVATVPPGASAIGTPASAPPSAEPPPAVGISEGSSSDDAVDPGEPQLVYENPEAQPEDPNVIALDALDRHVGESVRVRSHGGRTRVGTIESVGAQGITLKSPMGGGYARYTLPYSQITRVEKR